MHSTHQKNILHLRLKQFENRKHFQDYKRAAESGRLPDGSTLRGGLSKQQLMKKTAPSWGKPQGGAARLDKTGQLNKLVKDTLHDGLGAGEEAAKKGCSCQSCRVDRLKNRADKPTVDEQEKLQRKAVAKMVTYQLVSQLQKLPNTKLRKAYQRTLNCANYHYVSGGEITTEYCRCRWCLVCNRIRTAQLIDTYVPIIASWDKPQMLTLTIPNCSGFELEDKIDRMQDVWQSINRLMKRGRKRTTYQKEDGAYKRDSEGNRIVKDAPLEPQNFEALRKIECTYNIQRGDYHPHFHIAIDNPQTAHLIRMEWLKHFSEAEYSAQDITPIDKSDLGSVKELFKYFSKIFSTVKNSDGEQIQTAHVERLDVIFQAMHGKRTLQPYGFTKKDYQQTIERVNIADSIKSELSESEIEQIIEFEAELQQQNVNVPDGVYKWTDSGWKNERSSHQLVDWQPSNNLQQLVKNILIYGHSPSELCSIPFANRYSRAGVFKPVKTEIWEYRGSSTSNFENSDQTTQQSQKIAPQSWIVF